jgi:hypothetical protein
MLTHTRTGAHKTASGSGLLCAPVSPNASWEGAVYWSQFATNVLMQGQAVGISLACHVNLDLQRRKDFKHKYDSLMRRLHFFA